MPCRTKLSLKREVWFLIGEVKEKNAFIEQLNSNNNHNNNNDNNNNNNNNSNDNINNNKNIINRNNINNSNNYDNNILHKTSNTTPNISNNYNSSNVLNDVDKDDNNNNNNNNNNNHSNGNNKNSDSNNKNIKIFSNNKSSSSKNNNGDVVATDKSNDSNITFRSKKSKKCNKIDKNNNNNNNNDNSINENNNTNKSTYDNKVNSTSLSPTSKETVFILGDSMVKKLNDLLLTRKLNHKWFVKVRPFNSVKVRYMPDHEKPTVRDFDPDHIILHCGTNDLNSDRTSSQIAREMQFAISLKSDKNKVSISLLIPTSDKLNKKTSEVSNRLINMCSHRNIAYIDHSGSTQQNHINESKAHFNK